MTLFNQITMRKLYTILWVFFLYGTVFAQVPKPSDEFGFEPGADYKLAKYDQLLSYYKKLSESSERVELREIGKTTLGKPMIVLFISSEENINNLEKYRQISEEQARAKISNDKAVQNSKEGKAVVWIDGGLHATEVAGAQMIPELAYNIATAETDEMRNIRDNVIVILMPVMNPDGLDIVADWYYRNLGTAYETSSPPWLYHHYVGHDNNRDWFMNNISESYHVNEVLYNQWYPQIVYNHHQTSPAWARIFIPPFSNPVNPNIHPGITTSTNLIGTVMANRFALKRMPGVISHQTFSMWWNGGMRTVPYFHNMVGILTETAHATPSPRFYPQDSVPSNVGGRRGGMRTDGTQIFYSDPWKGGESHFRDAVDYMLTGSMAVLDFAADRKQHYLYNIYKMGADAIKGDLHEKVYAYIIPTQQRDDNEVVNLVNILRQGGVEVNRAKEDFTVGEVNYPKGSFIVYGAQSFRPYIVDLLEKQNYPDQRLYPGGPPNPPYDLAGWTLPLQMGVQVAKSGSEFKVETEAIAGRATIETGVVENTSTGYVIDPKRNASFKAINILMEQGEKIFRSKSPVGNYEAGAFIVKKGSKTEARVKSIAQDMGLDFINAGRWDNSWIQVNKPKIGLYKSWVANMDEGWTRWLLTQYNYDWDTLHDADISSKKLDQYTAIIFPSMGSETIMNGHNIAEMPAPFTGGLGTQGTLKIEEYVKNGGTILTFDASSTYAIKQFGLPVEDVTSGLSSQQFFIPGSLIRANVDKSNPLAYGMQDEIATSFNQSRAFSVIHQTKKGEGGNENIKSAPAPNVEVVVTYSKDNLLMSGWALGEKRYIGEKPAMLNVKYGKGNVVLYGFRPQFRGQPRATYKLIFNALY